MTIDQMQKQFASMAELQAYATSQYQTILKQSQKINTLEEEVIHLRKLLESSVLPAEDPSKKIEIFANVSDQEAVCRIELKKLKNLSIERELTLEEAKRTEIYTKLLLSMQEKNKSPVENPKRLDDKELLALLNEPEVEQEGIST